jgi:hypothetical protein
MSTGATQRQPAAAGQTIVFGGLLSYRLESQKPHVCPTGGRIGYLPTR